MAGAQIPWAGYAGFANFLGAMTQHTDELVRVSDAAEFGYITDDYSLIVEEFTGHDNEYHKYKPGQWYLARSRALPPDFMATTPDGVHGYMTRSVMQGEASITIPPAFGLMAGEHSHLGTGDHSHSWSGGNSAGGVGGQTSVEEPPIFSQHGEQHYHRVITPPYFAPPQPGDLVVILWIKKQVPFVIDVVANTRNILTNIPGQWGDLA